MVQNLRVGVYVDVENIVRTGGRGMRFDTLRDYACRDGGGAVRLNAYLAYDEERAKVDVEYRTRATRYHCAIRDVGFKVIEKPVQWYTNEDGVRVSKSNSDLDLAVDMLLQSALSQSARLDRVILASGDGDFVPVVRALQNMGCRVEVVAFNNVSYNLRCESDVFFSGFLVPGLLPAPFKAPIWGAIDSRVRGVCYHYLAEKGFGFFRYLTNLDNMVVTDTREPECPYREAFFHCSNVPKTFDPTHLLSRDFIWEFKLGPGKGEYKDRIEASDIELVTSYAAHTH